ncbi:MAG: ABC transporter ATP-binding protein [Desulfobacterales bacterium]|nr:ABC transporter ATP-binding protein [Desulfobacterales bacterium]
MQPILEVRNLVKCFPEVRAVDDISFIIEPGTCFGIIGPNGAGKTTTIEVIEGILSQTSGDILYKGKKRGTIFNEEVGIQLQNTELPMFLTVKETLDTFRNLYNNMADLDDLVETCHLKDIINRDNRKISGGQKQRLLLSMALANDPELVFLDEPTTGLDPQARRNLWDIVNLIKQKNKTVVLTTHYMDEAQILCDRIALMDYGKIIAIGSPAELLEKHCKGTTLSIKNTINKNMLEKLPWEWFKIQDRIEIHTNEMNECINFLLENKIDLSTMVVRSQNLEDLFLKMTGKQLRV